jgi:hypothetical protein
LNQEFVSKLFGSQSALIICNKGRRIVPRRLGGDKNEPAQYSVICQMEMLAFLKAVPHYVGWSGESQELTFDLFGAWWLAFCVFFHLPLLNGGVVCRKNYMICFPPEAGSC